MKTLNTLVALLAATLPALAGRQIPLCMVGDSITWYGQGDCWRTNLLVHLPELAFVGTHSARHGHSHAGEGGNSASQVLARVDDAARVPDCPYYHLLIGINDSAAATTAAQIWPVASNTASRIQQIVGKLLAREKTKKVFLGSILPGAFTRDEQRAETPRGLSGSAANTLLRDWLATYPDRARVVWVEYETPLRAADKYGYWRSATCLGDGLHPTAAGYAELANILAPVLAANAAPDAATPGSRCGVEVENRWNLAKGASEALIPGWYVLSFRPVQSAAGTVRLRLSSEDLQFNQTYSLDVSEAGRCQVEFMTGYEGYGYHESPFHIEVLEGATHLEEIQIEKMRPSHVASVYGRGLFIDSTSPVAKGELIRW